MQAIKDKENNKTLEKDKLYRKVKITYCPRVGATNTSMYLYIKVIVNMLEEVFRFVWI